MDKLKLYTVAIPRKFEPLILAEMERLGVDTRTACLDHVLQDYFDGSQLSKVEQPKPENPKEVEHRENSGSGMSRLQTQSDSGDTRRDADNDTSPYLFTFACGIK